MRAPHRRERREHGGLFALQRAGGDEHRPRSGGMRKNRSTRPAPRPAATRRRLERLELQAAGDGDARRVGADVDDAPRRLVALHAEAIDVGEHAPEEPARSR